MPRHIDANKAIEILRTFKTSESPNSQEQGINRGINLACWVLSDNGVLPRVEGVYLSKEEYNRLIEYKYMYEELCK